MAERDPGRTEPFVTLLPATEENCATLTDCFGPLWKMALPALYIRAGKYMPKLAKDRGAYLGLCDERGYRVADNTKATHIGITAGDGEYAEPLPTDQQQETTP
jgi:hypothetical protein